MQLCEKIGSETQLNVVRETEEGYWNVKLEKPSLVITHNRWSMAVWIREKSDGLQELVLQRQVESYAGTAFGVWKRRTDGNGIQRRSR